ncbi:MAG: hypothetical protein IJ736_09750 [Firmicutes bacterium]|nr:hypothetical protein [Bacillota bacterium]
MAKRLKSVIGNVVMIPVSEDGYGVARVLNKVHTVCLYEMYMAGPFKSRDEIKTEDVMKCKKVIDWGDDDHIRNGRWEIIENIVPEEEIEMPYFIDWADSYYTGNRKYFLVRGIFNDFLHYNDEDRIDIKDEEVEKYKRMGITSAGASISGSGTEYIFRTNLIYNEMLTEDSPQAPEYVDERAAKEAKEFEPFAYYKDDGKYCVTLISDGEYRQNLFDEFKDDGWLGSGDDWEHLAEIYIHENMKEDLKEIKFDSEAGMFAAYFKRARTAKKFLKGFKKACEDDEIMRSMLKNALPF